MVKSEVKGHDGMMDFLSVSRCWSCGGRGAPTEDSPSERSRRRSRGGGTARRCRPATVTGRR